MDVRYSPEQLALRDSVAKVVEQHGPHAVGSIDDGERAARLEAAVVASGWRELRTPESNGAPLASGVEVAIVAEQLGRGLADAPFVGPTLAAELRRLAGAPVASEPETVAFGGDLAEPAVVARGDLADGRLAVDGRGAGVALVLLPDPGGHTIGTVGVGPPAHEVDLTRSTVAVATEPAEPVPGQVRPIVDAELTRWTALGLAATSADLVGVMAGATQLARDYAAQRQQYGTVIGSFQAVQHLLADAHVATEGSRSAALHAAWAVDALPPDEALVAGAGAKAYCARAARMVCETAIQVHGGIGNTWECLAHVFLRRALLSCDLFGGIGPNLERVLAHRGLATTGEPAGAHHGLR